MASLLADLDELGHRFQMSAIGPSEWTHVAHLCVGAWHIERLGLDRAITSLRTGILRLNEINGTPNDDSHGYHETITVAYARLISEFLSLCPDLMDFRERVTRLTESALGSSDFLFNYYTRDLLLSKAARKNWMDPDLAPLKLPSDILASHLARERATPKVAEAQRGHCRFC